MAARPSLPKPVSERSGSARTSAVKTGEKAAGKSMDGREAQKPGKAPTSRLRNKKLSALGVGEAGGQVRGELSGESDARAPGVGVAATPRVRRTPGKGSASKGSLGKGTSGKGTSGKGPTKVAGVRGRPAVFTREDILVAAKLAFSKEGYANVTLDDLAALLNTGKGTLYYHSNKKVDLLIAISTKTVENNTYELRKIASVNASPEARFILAMRALMMGVLSDQPASKVYFENESDLPPKFRVNLRRLLREIQQVFEDIITEGVAQGVFQGEPRILAKHVLSICAWPYRWFSPEGQMSLDEFINSAVNFALAGIRSPQAAMHERLSAKPGRALPGA